MLIASGFEMNHGTLCMYMMSRYQPICHELQMIQTRFLSALRNLPVDESSIIRTGLLLSAAGLCYNHG